MPTRLLCYFMTQHFSQQRYNFPTSPTSGSRYWRPPGHRGTENWKTPRVSHIPTPRRRLRTMSERGVTLTLHLVQKIGQVMIAPEVTVVGEFAMTQFFVEHYSIVQRYNITLIPSNERIAEDDTSCPSRQTLARTEHAALANRNFEELVTGMLERNSVLVRAVSGLSRDSLAQRDCPELAAVEADEILKVKRSLCRRKSSGVKPAFRCVRSDNSSRGR